MNWASLVSKLANRQGGQAFNATNLGMLFVGLVLLIAAVRDVTIKDTLTALFKGQLPTSVNREYKPGDNSVKLGKAGDLLKDSRT